MPSQTLFHRAHLPLAFFSSVIILSALAASFPIPGAAKTKDPPWIAKDWTHWDSDDCDAVLKRSPWGTDPSYRNFSNFASSPIAVQHGGIAVQLRSALPIRQALLRKVQLDKFYDKMKPDKKQAFDQAQAHDLDPADRIVIDIWNSGSETLRYISPTYSEEGAYYEFPPISPYSYTSAFPARQVALRLADGTLIQPTEATVMHMDNFLKEVQYSFPRVGGNTPAILAGQPSLAFELGASLRINMKSGNFDQPLPFIDSGLSITFKLSAMMYNGKLEY
jgi:hypothetical protein